MPSRSVRRRQHKQLAQLNQLSDGQRRVMGTWHLSRWRSEATRRANDLGELEVWQLEAHARSKALALDPSGELAEDLSRICAEAVSQASGKNLLRNGRSKADQRRLGERHGIGS